MENLEETIQTRPLEGFIELQRLIGDGNLEHKGNAFIINRDTR